MISLALTGQFVTGRLGLRLRSLILAWRVVVSDGKIIQGKHTWFVFREMVLKDKEGLKSQKCG